MMQAREFRELCEEVAKETGHSVEQVMEMAKDTFECAQTHIANGSLTPIYFQFLGRFEVQEGRKNYLKQLREKHDSKQPELPDRESTDSPSEDGGV